MPTRRKDHLQGRDESGIFTSVGFTGTVKGMTPAQEQSVRGLFVQMGWKVLHHGDCVGADAQAHDIARSLGMTVHLHPPDDPKARAFKQADRSAPEKPYLDRNDDIVKGGQVLVATPRGTKEVLRSGTWSTIRRARKAGRDVFIVWPDGSVKHNFSPDQPRDGHGRRDESAAPRGPLTDSHPCGQGGKGGL